jgi:hypothetical protein
MKANSHAFSSACVKVASRRLRDFVAITLFLSPNENVNAGESE